MARAIWNGTVLAESQETFELEGNTYFPEDSLHHEYFQESQRHTACPWKGLASYYDITVDGEQNSAAAWTYPDPSDAAARIANHVAFWKGVEVEP